MRISKEELEKEKQKEETKEEKDNEYINRIRRVSCYRVNKKRHSPVMMGRLLGKSSNKKKKEVFIADTGTSVIIIPVNIARRNGIVWTQVDADEPSCAGVTGVEVDVMGKANVWAVFDNIKGGHNLQVLITRQEADGILIDLDTLIDLSIVPPDFPLPQDPELKSDNCRRVEENKVTEYAEEREKRLKEETERRKEQESSTEPKPI